MDGNGGDAAGDGLTGFANIQTSDLDDQLAGDAGRNDLYGYAGNDTISGGDGRGVLRGFHGEDICAFNSRPGMAHFDRIRDFEANTDQIALDSAVFAVPGPGSLDASAFMTSDAQVVTTADHQVLQDTDSGVLFNDPDGAGSAALCAADQPADRPCG